MKKGTLVTKLISITAIVFIALFLASPIATAGDFVSKKYNYKPGTKLELGAAVNDVVMETIIFKLPGEAKGKRFSFAGNFKADVEIANKSKTDVKVGLAIALFDAQGSLVGVGSGGSKMFFDIKSGKKKEYTATFYYVTENIEEATTFQITLEIR